MQKRTSQSDPVDRVQRKLKDAEAFADQVRRRSEDDIDRYGI